MGDCRARIRLKRPNPLFERWIEELYLNASSRESKSCNQLKIALDSLKKYPLVLNSGSECVILKGFGKNLCKILDRKLAGHGNTNTLKIGGTQRISVDKINNTPSKRRTTNVKAVNKDKNTEYVPSYRSGAYALLITLSIKSEEHNYKGYMTKSELISESQKYCDQSMTTKKPGSFYTAWSSITTLISKNLVLKLVRKGYCLSEVGSSLAIKLQPSSIDNRSNAENMPSVCDENVSLHASKQIQFEKLEINHNHNQEKSKMTKFNNFELKISNEELFSLKNHDEGIVEPNTKVFLPNNFEVILLVDKQETSGSKKDEMIRSNMERFTMIKYELRHLKVGDFAWVARNSSGDEIVLPYIVERKRMDDLAHSIKDGRFHEQKFRLKHCGIPNIIYLVESHGNNQHTGMPIQSLMQAVVNTRIQNGFMTHFTSSVSDSLKFLAMMTKMLSDNYISKTLVSCRKEDLSINDRDSDRVKLMLFEDFNVMASKSKTLSVADMFIKQLLQLKGITVQKATAIVSKYESPRNLINAFQDRSLTKPELLLTNVTINSSKFNISPGLSKVIYSYYTAQKLI